MAYYLLVCLQLCFSTFKITIKYFNGCFIIDIETVIQYSISPTQ